MIHYNGKHTNRLRRIKQTGTHTYTQNHSRYKKKIYYLLISTWILVLKYGFTIQYKTKYYINIIECNIIVCSIQYKKFDSDNGKHTNTLRRSKPACAHTLHTYTHIGFKLQMKVIRKLFKKLLYIIILLNFYYETVKTLRSVNFNKAFGMHQ